MRGIVGSFGMVLGVSGYGDVCQGFIFGVQGLDVGGIVSYYVVLINYLSK